MIIFSIEPNLTPARYWGGKCNRCGCHVRRKKQGSCVRCSKDKVNQLRRRQCAVGSAHPRRERQKEWQKAYAWRSRYGSKRDDFLDKLNLSQRKHYRTSVDRRIKAWIRGVERRLAKDRRTVRWSNKEAIRDFYRLAHRLSVTTGIKHEVDHIIPLRGINVCGLHVENNLQVITATENRAKWHLFDDEDPSLHQGRWPHRRTRVREMNEPQCEGCGQRPEVYGSSWCARCHSEIPLRARDRIIALRNALITCGQYLANLNRKNPRGYNAACDAVEGVLRIQSCGRLIE